MNVTEYIASGILESYVMGVVSDQERHEVECLSSIYPEIRQELDNLSEALENYAFLNRVQPPAFLKAQLLSQLDFSQPEGLETEKNSQAEERSTIVRPMPIATTTGLAFRASWVVAASMGLILLLFSFFLLSQLRSNQKLLTSLRNVNSSLQSQLQKVREKQSQQEQTVALLSQPGLRTMELKGNEKAPDGSMLVFWNTQTHQVAVQVQSLPALPADKQYQLWSLVNGQPVDAGVFDPIATNKQVQQMNRPIVRADAFAVTIEKRGGSPTPTLSTLLAMTAVKS